jgi:hypothetical protein|tara:strand:+ start:1177 stop:2352 length:1176 start_codon:yes stop_codon:yes gene_type:complete
MILLASLFGTPLELFGTEPNQDLIFRSYVNSFSNTKTWVTNAFTSFFNNCWGPNWWTDGRQIDDVEAIVQTQTPQTQVTDTNITGGSYAWHIRFTDTEGDLRHQVFYFNPTTEFAFGSSAASGCQTRKNFLMGYDNSGPQAIGVADGAFIPLAGGDTGSSSWELQNTSYCIGNVTITKNQCGKWYLEQIMGEGCHEAPVYKKQHSCTSGYADGDGNAVEVWKKQLGSSTEGNAAYKIYQKVGESLPYKLITYNCATGQEMQTTYYETRNEADTVGSAHVTTQYNDSVTEGNLGDDDWPDQISRICETDNGGDDDDPPLIGTCADPNDSGYGQTECVGCNDGYEDNSDGLGCVEIQDNDDDDDNGDDSNNLKWIGYGAAGLFGLLIINKLAS